MDIVIGGAGDPMTNFDFLLSVPEFASFGEIAAAAEKIYSQDKRCVPLSLRRKLKKMRNAANFSVTGLDIDKFQVAEGTHE